MRWEKSTDTTTQVVGYNVEYRRPNKGNGWTKINQIIDPLNISVILTDLDPNEKVYFHVNAVDSAGNTSVWSDEREGYTFATNTTIQTTDSGYNDIDGHYIDLQWQQVPAAGYHLYRKGPNESGFAPITSSAVVGNKYRDSNLIAHGTYTYRIVSCNDNWDATPLDDSPGNPVTVTIKNIAPTAPVAISPKNFSNKIVSVNYQKNDNAGRDVDGDVITYTVKLNEVGGNLVNPAADGTYSLSYGKQYTWYVEANDGKGGVIQSNTLAFKVDDVKPTITVDNLSIDYAMEHKIKITAVDDLSGLNELKYKWGTLSDLDNDEGFASVVSGTQITAPNGRNTLLVVATDAAGNKQVFNHEYLVDSEPPVFTNISVLNTGIFNNTKVINTSKEVTIDFHLGDVGSGLARYGYAIVVNKNLTNADSLQKVVLTTPTERNFALAISKQLQQGKTYYIALWACDKAGGTTTIIYSEPFTVDETPAVIGKMQLTGTNLSSKDGIFYVDDLKKLTLNVTASDQETGVTGYKYGIFKDGKLIGNWTTSINAAIDGNTLVNGATYQFGASVTNGAGSTSQGLTQAIVYDNTAPQVKQLADEGTSKRNNTSLTAFLNTEDKESGIESIQYAIGKLAGQADVVAWKQAGNLENQELYVPNLNLANGKYYFTVKVQNKAGLVTTYSSDGIIIDSTLPYQPEVKDDGIFTSSKTELHALFTLIGTTKEVLGYDYRIRKENTVVVDWKTVQDSGTNGVIEILHTGIALEQNAKYYFDVRVNYSDNSKSPIGSSNGITVDYTGPENLTIDDGTYSSGNGLSATWSASDPQSGIVGYKYAIGATHGGKELTNGWVDIGLRTSVIRSDLTLDDGKLYYFTVVAVNGAGQESIVNSDGVMVDRSAPPQPYVQDEGEFTRYTNHLKASWTWTRTPDGLAAVDDKESGIKEYKYAILTERSVTENTAWISNGTGTTLDFDLAADKQLQNGMTYYVAVKVTNGAGVETVGFSDGITVDNQAPKIPDVDDGGDYAAVKDKLVATLTAEDLISGVSKFNYWMGTEDNKGEIANAVSINAINKAAQVLKSNLSLTEGKVYFTAATAVDNAGNTSGEGRSNGLMIDTKPPVITSLKDDGNFTLDSKHLYAEWTAQSFFAPIKKFYVGYATSPDDYIKSGFNWIDVGLQHSAQINVQLTAGTTYYVFVKAIGANGLESTVAKTDGIKVEATAPVTPTVTTSKYSNRTIDVTWVSSDPESGISEYRYAVGYTRSGTELTGGWITTTEAKFRQTFDVLQDGTAYCVSVQAKNAAGMWSDIGYSNASVVDIAGPSNPTISYTGNSFSSDFTRSTTEIDAVNWKAKDDGIGNGYYRYVVIEDKTNVVSPLTGQDYPTDKTDITFDVKGLSLQEGHTYYVAIQVFDKLGNASKIGFSAPIKVDSTAPTLTLPTADKEIVTNDGDVKVTWQSNEAGQADLNLQLPDATTWNGQQATVVGNNTWTAKDKQLVELVGKYTLKFSQIDAAGNKSEEKIQKIRFNANPTVNMGGNREGTKGKAIEFIAQAGDYDGTIVSYTWDFGDGTTAQGEKAVHKYNQLGTYTATLTVVDNDGGKGVDSVKVTINNTTEGDLFMDETWNNTMLITGIITVPTGTTLTISPGTQLQFKPQAGIIVYGTLKLQGSEASPIVGSFVQEGDAKYWQGIRIIDSSTANSIRYANLSGARQAVSIENSAVTVDSSIIKGNYIGIHVLKGTAIPLIKTNTISDNFLYGIKEELGATPTVSGNTFSNNGANYYEDTKTILTDEQVKALGNKIE